jgi:hypothetical protein
MPPDLYNPCPDGLPAKAWECLRRNKAFRKRSDRLKELRAEETESNAAHLQRIWLQRVQQPIAHVALSHLFPLDIEKDKILRARFNVDTLWLKTSGAFRAAFASVLTPESAGEKTDPRIAPPLSVYVLPKRISPPPRGIIGRLTSEEGRSELAAWLLLWEPVLKAGAWSIPQKIRDPAHRNAILDELRKATPIAELPAGPDTKKGSGYLGTEADWDTWLFISDLQTRVGISRLKAEYQAAWRRFDFKSYSDWPEAERLSNSAEYAAESVHERNAHHITRSRQTVDNAIKSIYPRRKFLG